MRLFYMIGLVICLQNLGFAQQTGGLNGEIIDKNTQKPISGATVKLINTTYVTTSDSLGKYAFRNIPTGQYQITVISLGSLPYNLYNVIVSSGNITSNSIN